MILSVTLNPLLELRLTYNGLNYGTENRNGYKELKSGGKGINVTRQLNHLKINTENLSLTFAGGNFGRIFKEILLKENIKSTFIRTEDETRIASIIIDKPENKITSFFGENSKITSGEAEEFKNKLEKIIPNCELVLFSGSSSCKETNSIFSFGIKTANKYDKISVCDTYGEHLEDCIDASPTILHNNISEIEKSLKKNLTSEKDKLDFLEFLYSKNIKQSYLTDGANTFYASNFDYHYKINTPKIDAVDPTGSGDSFTAGIIYSWHNDLTFEETLTLAVSLGAINAASYNTCTVTMDQVEKLKEKIEIFPTGKKMKIIDVTPH